MRSFFKVSVKFKSKNDQSLMNIDVIQTNFPKNPKKTCFQNGNTICEHKFVILKRLVTGLDKIFLILDLKKKEQKRARAVLADFLKNIFF